MRSNGHAVSSLDLLPSEPVVLLAEDDFDLAEMYCRTFGEQGFLVVIAEDGEKAVQLADEIAPNVICLDVRMPRLDGLGALDQIRKNPRTSEVPVVMVTNYDEPGVMERAGALGAVRFIVKANTAPVELAAVLREILNLPERRKPGRLPLGLGANPARDAEQMISAYRELLQTATNVLAELGTSGAEEQRRQIAGYAAQFRAQLGYWHSVLQRAEEATRAATGDVRQET